MAEESYRRWLCDACGYVYDEACGDPDSGLPPGTRYEQIPDDWACPLCGLRKRDLRLLSEQTKQPVSRAQAQAMRPASAKDVCSGGEDYVVIVGAGIAGWSVAEAIRARIPERPLLMVTACEGLIYPKPALSMALAQGKSAEGLVEDDAQTRAAELKMEIRTGSRVLKIDPHRKRLTTSQGGITYGKVVLALGGQQRALPIQGDAAEQVLRVNDLTAYRTLRARLESGARHVTVLGAGLIGCEFAEDFRGAGYEVTVVDPGGAPLASLLPHPLSERLRERLHDRGIRWRFGLTVDRVDSAGARVRAMLCSGDAFDTDIVLSAAGLAANTELAVKAGLEIDRGITVDRHMRTSCDDIYALGDCASVEGRVHAFIEPIRRQARAVTADLAGTRAPFQPLQPLIRVKTPSLPLAICPPPGGQECRWNLVESTADEMRVDCAGEHGLLGFALAGARVADGMRLYREVIARA